jgi:hypothetical protein
MRRILVFTALVAGCNNTTIQTPTRSLDRPSDIALVCATWRQEEGKARMLPLSACNQDNTDGGVPIADGGVGAMAAGTLFALASNTNRGEVALTTTNPTAFNKLNSIAPQLVDLDPNTPGFGFLPVGSSPEHMRATADGCRAVTANADGCDLAVVKVAELIATEAGDQPHPAFLSDFVQRIQPQVNGVPIRARPTWIEISPATTNLGAAGTIAACSAADYKAIVAFPGCQLVAEVDLGSGELKRAVQVTRNGPVVIDLAQVSCPTECSGFTDDGGSPAPTGDGGAPVDASVPTDGGMPDASMMVSDGGGAPLTDGSNGQPPILPSTQAYPHTLAVADDGPANRMLYIGDALSPLVSAVRLDDGAGTFVAATSVTLADNAIGADVVRVSPRITDPDVTDPGVRYLYVIARDGTIRVIDVDLPAECELNPDPEALSAMYPLVDANLNVVTDPLVLERTLRCLPVGDPKTPPRAPLATTPGLTLQGNGLGRDVAFVHVKNPFPASAPATTGTASAANSALLVGDFAFIIDSNGHADVVNIADRCPAPNDPMVGPSTQVTCDPAAFANSVMEAAGFPGNPVPQTIEILPNRLRNNASRFIKPAESDVTGSPRLSDVPAIAIAGTSQDPFDTALSEICNVPVAGTATDGGVSAPVGCVGLSSNVAANLVAFPNVNTPRNETWSFSWEGTLPGTIRATGALSGPTLIDRSQQFCLRAVESGDKVFVTGCIDDTGCTVEQQCFHDPGAPTVISSSGTVLQQGLCLPRDPGLFAQAQNLCGDWTRAIRRWSVTQVAQGQLGLDEIAEPEHPVDTRACLTDDDCTNVKVLGQFNNEATALGTSCLDSPTGKSCLRPCTTNPTAGTPEGVCGEGFVCAGSRFGGQRCLRAPLPPTDAGLLSLCFGEPLQYEIHAGESFQVHGDVTVLPSPFTVDPMTQLCIPNPNPPPQLGLARARLPIAPPLCDASVASVNWLAQSPMGESNSCRLPSLTPPTTPDTPQTIFLHFENPVFVTNLMVPPTPLLQSETVNVFTRVPADDTVVSFAVIGGFHTLSSPIGVDVIAQMPRSTQTAPDSRTIYVVDEGKQPLASGLRGQLLRMFADTQTSDQTFEIH